MIGMGRSLLLATLLCLFQAEQTGSIGGTVKDRDGNGVAGVPVTLFLVTSENVVQAGSTETDADGKYRFAELAAGTYVLEYSRGPCTAEVSNLRFLEKELAEAASLPVASQQQQRSSLHQAREKTFALVKGHAHRVSLRPGSSLTHDVYYPSQVPVRVVIDADTLPDERITIQLRREDGDGGPMPPEARVEVPGPPGLTGTSIPLGPVEVDENHGVTFEGVVEGIHVPILQIGSVSVEFGPSEVRGTGTHTIHITPGPYRVRFRVLDARGRPVAEVFGAEIVHLAGGGSDPWSPPRRSVHALDMSAGEDGVFEIPYVEEGQHLLRAQVGWPPNVETAAVPVRVGRDEPCPEVELRVPPTGKLVVVIRDPSGDPERRIYVRARRAADGAYIVMNTTSAEGAEFRSIAVGTWTIRIQPVGGEQGDETQVEIKPYETTDATLVVED